jgi:hypothetical protein
MNEHPWTAVETNPQCEDLAERALRALGYEPWLPKFAKLLRGQRIEAGRYVRSRSDTTELRPLFRGYLFVPVPHDDAGYAIDTAHGVRRLLRHPHTEEGWGKPKLIRARVIVQLQEAVELGIWEDSDGKLRYGKPKLRVAEGDTVRTPTGFVGQLVLLDEQGRYELLTDILGAKRRVRGDDAHVLELAIDS